jgi:DNA protecting protein DprA
VDELPLPDHSTAPSSFQLSRNDDGVPFWLLDGWPETEPTLSVQGAWPPSRRAIAIVGSTTPAPEARSWAFSLARFAAARGWAIVSGLARGIDAAAHEGALAAGGKTIAITGNGLHSVYPAEHTGLAERILASSGTRMTFAAADEPISRERLLQRNALTSAAGIAVIAVQSRGRHGTLATMRHAFEQGRFLATFYPPESSAPGDWGGNALLLGAISPWRSKRNWSPAFRIDAFDEMGYVALLKATELHIDLLDSTRLSRETAPKAQTIHQTGLFTD